MLNAWHAFRRPSDHLNVIVFHDQAGQLVGLAPWYRRQGFASGTTLRFLADGSVCSDFQTVLTQPEYADQVRDSLIDWLSSPSQSWDQLELEGCCESDAWMNAFHQAMAARGHRTHWKQTLNTWRIDLQEGWDTVKANFSKTQHAQLRNFINRFDKSDYRFRLASTHASSIDYFVGETIRLHQLRWQACGEPGCFAAPAFKQFFQHAMRDMIIDGSADIALLERQGRAVAANVWLIRNNIGFGYQCGRDPAEDAHKVGRIMQSVSLRHHIQQGLIAYDYLRGDEQYKADLRAKPTPCGRLRIVARARLPELRHSIWETCRDVKAMFTSAPKT